MKGLRGERLGGEFQKEISNIISLKMRSEFSRLSAIISVTSVETAKVYISIYDTDKERAADSFEILRQNSGIIRHELSKIMHLRTVPELRIIKDESMEYGEKIDKILSELDKDEK